MIEGVTVSQEWGYMTKKHPGQAAGAKFEIISGAGEGEIGRRASHPYF